MNTKEQKNEKKRYELPDTLRGAMLVSMMIYHACWNFVYIYGMPWDWYKTKGAYVWQQSICWTFIILSGFCFSLGKHSLKNGLLVFGSGALVTVVTLLFMPENRVVFGVLTCIGSCQLLVHIMRKILKKVPAEGGLGVAFFLFLLTKNINEGYLGIGNIRIWELPQSWYCNYGTAFWGFPFKGFYSTDFFSLFPWFFLFLTGFYLYFIFEKKGWLKTAVMKTGFAPFSFLGRHSLLIYLVHQPVIYGIQRFILELFSHSL